MHGSFDKGHEYKVVIFDLDGVVIDSCQDIIDSARHLMDYYGYEPKDDAFIRGCIGGGAKNLLGRCMGFEDMNVPADDVQNPKPHRECVDTILSRVNSKSEETIIIGDTKTDISTGKNAGIDTCGVLYGFGTEEEVTAAGPNYIIKDLMELKEIIM